MTQTMSDILAESSERRFVGRDRELTALMSCLEEDGPAVAFVHGMAGIGKTTLLRRFAVDAERAGGTVTRLDCADVEPTEQGFLTELATATVPTELRLENVAAVLGTVAAPVVIVLDHYEHVFSLDTWIRQEFAPALPRNGRIVIGSRERPLPGWHIAPGWEGLFLPVALGPLSDDEAEELMQRGGLSSDQAQRANRVAHGHPLAIRLAMATFADQPEAIEQVDFELVIQRLADLHLGQVGDPALRDALQAASVLRRVTVPLLAALLPGQDPRGLYDQIRSLPYVEATRDGLAFHAAVQGALAASLRAADPERYRGYRQAAWRELRAESRRSGAAETWRCTADMLFILDNPYIREAFFPTNVHPLSIEAAAPGDGKAVSAIAARHETPAAAALMDLWWNAAPGAFKVLKNHAGTIAGFYVAVDSGMVDSSIARRDPLTYGWRRHLREHPVGKDECVIFLRRWLSEKEGELPSAVQGACWLNIKQSYMALRPHLRRCYIAVSDLQTYGPVAQSLGFALVDGASVDLDGAMHHLAVLDMGPGSVDGWLAAHVARELGMDEGGIVDLRSHELVIDGRRAHLTPLEFDLMRYLVAHEGKPVTRAAIIEAVWGYEASGESNVVDVVVGSLRRKLGNRAPDIETVRGVGYLFRRQ